MDNKIANLVLDLLTEARRSDLPYTEKKTKGEIDKVIVTLSGNESGKFTKLAKQFKDLKEKTEELAAATNKLNTEIKESAIEFFDAADEIHTRIVETISMTILIGKRQPDSIEKTSKVNYEQIIKDITALVPDLSDKIDEIIQANTQVEEKLKVAKAPQLRVDLKEDFSFDSIIKFARSIGKKLLSSIKTWGRSYDKQVSDIRKRIEQLA